MFPIVGVFSRFGYIVPFPIPGQGVDRAVSCHTHPHGMNDCTPCPVAKGVRDYFYQHVVRAVHISVYEAAQLSQATAGPQQGVLFQPLLNRAVVSDSPHQRYAVLGCSRQKTSHRFARAHIAPPLQVMDYSPGIALEMSPTLLASSRSFMPSLCHKWAYKDTN